MRLLTKTGIYYFIFSIIFFTLGGVIFYYQLENVLDEELVENLYKEKGKLMKEASELNNQNSMHTLEQFFENNNMIKLSKISQSIPERLIDTIMYSSSEEELEPYKILIFSVSINGQHYSVRIFHPELENEDLVESIVTTFGVISGALLIILAIFTQVFSRIMWSPFHKTLSLLRDFDLNNQNQITFPPESIFEFRILNEELQKITDRIQKDYKNLKEFTENAAHEIQTPLASVQSILEILIQSDDLSEERINSLHNMYESINRLSKLIQSLLLLAKIENRQFHETKLIHVNEFIETRLHYFEDMILHKNIKVETQWDESLEVIMNPYLADILFSNLIGNAIKHNINYGKIFLKICNRSLKVTNTGSIYEVDPEELFERFRKANSASDSAGLGLSIVKQICSVYTFNLSYSLSGNQHTLTIQF